MKTRILTAIIGLAIFIGLLLLQPVVFTIALAAVILVMLYECYRAINADLAMKIVGFISAAMMMLTMYFMLQEEMMVFLVFIAATIVVLLHMVLVVAEHGRRSYKDVLANGFLTLYVTVSMWCILFVREFFETNLMLLIFISAWSCDTFAYFSGRLFGKHKLIPHVSPNKTVEGAIGGVIGAVFCSVIYFLILYKLQSIDSIVRGNHFIGFTTGDFIDRIGWGGFAVIAFAGGICSQIGDLIASAIKRDEDIKDFGWIFPGHGGFMDRFDSVMFISPIILMLLMIFVMFAA